MTIYVINAPKAAHIEVEYAYRFTGTTVTVSGSILTHCNCTTQVFIDDQEVAVGGDGVFFLDMDIPENRDKGDLIVTAVTKGKFPNPTTKTVEVKAQYIRNRTPLKLINVPQEWGDKKIQIAAEVLPETDVEILGSEYPAKWEEKDSSGALTVILESNFDTAIHNRDQTYRVTAEKEGYAYNSKEITIKNSQYRERGKDNSMQTFSDQAAIACAKRGIRAIIPNRTIWFPSDPYDYDIEDGRLVDTYFLLGGMRYTYICLLTLSGGRCVPRCEIDNW
ncbi:hypothetical protein H6770_00825 [Candidatus Peribacteria bacterium]|nr:hypothetical protein [Candidatus Peribacteria bacterium]